MPPIAKGEMTVHRLGDFGAGFGATGAGAEAVCDILLGFEIL